MDTPCGGAYGGRMSDVPADEGPEPGGTENARDFLADALSPVVDPDYDSRASAQADEHQADEQQPEADQTEAEQTKADRPKD